MKYSNWTYYLLAVLCMIATSCVTDGVMDDCTDNSNNQILVQDARVNMVITFPSATNTRTNENIADGLESERKIDDVHIYTFQNDKFIEKIKYVLVGGKDGDVTRTIEGMMTGTYVSNIPMEFVVIVNAENKGITNLSIGKNQSKNTLYQKLIFNYENNNSNWSEYIPMWGVGTIANVQQGTYNVGNLTLKRAIAKVDVTVNEGNGIKGFQIKEIVLHKYNTQGFCAPTSTSQEPSIPGSSTISENSLSSGELQGAAGNSFENQFYIPEQKNIGVDEQKKIYLTIKATMNGGNPKTYILPFIKDGSAYDVLRNYVYVFNITSVKSEIESTLKYEVKSWEEEEVKIPSFD